MTDQAPTKNPEIAIAVLNIEISGEPRRVAKYLELLEMEIRTSVMFMDAMFHNAEPSGARCPSVSIRPIEVKSC